MIIRNLLFHVTTLLEDIKTRINFRCIMPKLKKGATPSELVKGVTATRMLTIGRKTEPDNKLTITSQSLPFLFWSNDFLWIGAETTPFHHYVNCEFS
ncbi:hypothetical protein T4A_11495 [Trichinella pseudospiralis]|uniref:Uncharacterized protein n=2 Tax=Trichinella pseudospiralis TaxID=6337 RepID=A0A0V1DWN0_TRIPS|nr:hypothetical protein T4A_11495 [Trichinella pseudospiralis]